jgi:hypothetical protein
MTENHLNSTGSGRKALILAAAFAAIGLVAAAPAAEARGFVSIGVGLPFYPAPAYYYPPVVYAAPPVVYAPAPAPVYAPAPADSNGQCRDYTTTQNIGGTPQQVVGTACLQPDGSWRIVK